MGNFIVVRDADFSSVAVEHVELITGWHDVDLSEYADTTVYLSSTGWGTSSSNHGKLVPVGSAKQVWFTANSQNKGQIVFSTATDQSGTAVANGVVTLEVGTTSEIIDIPSDALAIFVGTLFNSQDRTPVSFRLFYP